MDFTSVLSADVSKELMDGFNLLKNHLKELQEKNEELKQQNHNILLEKSRMLTLQEDLSNELESTLLEHSKHTKEIEVKHQNILDSINSKSSLKYEQYEAEIEQLNTELTNLKSTTLSENKSCNCKKEQLQNLNIISELQDDIRNLKIDHLEEMNDVKNIMDNLSLSKQQLEDEYEILQENLKCAKQNLAARKEEISVLQEQLQEAQEEVSTLRAETAALKRSPDHGPKGNSLFAEVNDRRVKIELILKDQNEKFARMRREHAQSIRENNAIRSKVIQLEKTLASFKDTIGAEDSYRIEQYQKNIRELDERIKELQIKLKSRDEYIGNLARQNSEGWIDAFMKDSNEQLKKKQELLDAKCLQKAFSDDCYRTSQKELSRCKYNAMKNEAKIIQLELQLQEMRARTGYNELSETESTIKTSIPDTPPNNVVSQKNNSKPSIETNTLLKLQLSETTASTIKTSISLTPSNNVVSRNNSTKPSIETNTLLKLQLSETTASTIKTSISLTPPNHVFSRNNSTKPSVEANTLNLKLPETEPTIKTSTPDTPPNNVFSQKNNTKPSIEINTITNPFEENVTDVNTKENNRSLTPVIILDNVDKKIASATLKKKSPSILKDVNSCLSIYSPAVNRRKSVRFTSDTFSPKPSDLKNRRIKVKKGPIVPFRIIPSAQPRPVQIGIPSNTGDSNSKCVIDFKNSSSVLTGMQDSVESELRKSVDKNITQELVCIEKNGLENEISLQDELQKTKVDSNEPLHMVKNESNEEYFTNNVLVEKKINLNEELIVKEQNSNKTIVVDEEINLAEAITSDEYEMLKKCNGFDNFNIYEDSICLGPSVSDELCTASQQCNSFDGFTIYEDSICNKTPSLSKEQNAASQKCQDVDDFKIYEDSICKETPSVSEELRALSQKSNKFDDFKIYEDSICKETPSVLEEQNTASQKCNAVDDFKIFEDSICKKTKEDEPVASKKSNIFEGIKLLEDNRVDKKEIKNKTTVSEEPLLTENLKRKNDNCLSGGTRRIPRCPTRIIPSARKNLNS